MHIYYFTWLAPSCSLTISLSLSINNKGYYYIKCTLKLFKMAKHKMLANRARIHQDSGLKGWVAGWWWRRNGHHTANKLRVGLSAIAVGIRFERCMCCRASDSPYRTHKRRPYSQFGILNFAPLFFFSLCVTPSLPLSLCLSRPLSLSHFMHVCICVCVSERTQDTAQQ